MSKEQNPNTCQQAPASDASWEIAKHFGTVIAGEIPNTEYFSTVYVAEGRHVVNLRNFRTDDIYAIPLDLTLAIGQLIEDSHRRKREIANLSDEAAQRNNVVSLLQKQLSDLEKELCAFQGFLATRGLSSTEGNTITQKIMLLLMSWEMKLEEAQEKDTKLGEILHTRIEEEIADAITKPLEESFKAAQQYNKDFATNFQTATYKSLLEIAGQEQKKVFKVLDKLLNSEDAGEFSKAQIKGRKILNAYNQAVKEHKDNG
jgi:hypothetical protein